jgi:hypothetical protein
VLTEQIDEAAACRADAPYLEDAGGTATQTSGTQPAHTASAETK